MFYDLVLGMDRYLRGELEGQPSLNERIAAVADWKGEPVPPVKKLHPWTYPLPSEADAFPYLAILIPVTIRLEPRGQLKWKGDFRVEWHWVIDVQEDGEDQKAAALTAHAIRWAVDYLPCLPEINEVRNLAFETTPWPSKPGARYLLLRAVFDVNERDEFPLPPGWDELMPAS